MEELNVRVMRIVKQMVIVTQKAVTQMETSPQHAKARTFVALLANVLYVTTPSLQRRAGRVTTVLQAFVLKKSATLMMIAL
jgi:hypothetical protein